MTHRAQLVATSVILVLSAPAIAQTPNLRSACPVADTPTQAAPPVDPVALLYAALFSVGTVRAGIFDADGDGAETQSERIAGVFLPNHCASLPPGRCGKADQSTLHQARQLLMWFLDSEVQATRNGTPSSNDIKASPLLDDVEYAIFAQKLDERRRFFTLQCRSASPNAAAAASPAGEDRFRMVGSLDGLSMRRGTPALLGAIPQAEVAWVDDRAARKSTFDLNAGPG